jgi:hypothetical protein
METALILLAIFLCSFSQKVVAARLPKAIRPLKSFGAKYMMQLIDFAETSFIKFSGCVMANKIYSPKASESIPGCSDAVRINWKATLAPDEPILVFTW